MKRLPPNSSKKENNPGTNWLGHILFSYFYCTFYITFNMFSQHWTYFLAYFFTFQWKQSVLYKQVRFKNRVLWSQKSVACSSEYCFWGNISRKVVEIWTFAVVQSKLNHLNMFLEYVGNSNNWDFFGIISRKK